MKKGLIHIYTGDGKGKTTAAIGLAIRALGHKLSVCYAYFHKNPEKDGYAETQILQDLGVEIHGIAQDHPFFNPDIDPKEHRKQAEAGLDQLVDMTHQKKYDLLVMDEVIIAVHSGFLPEEKLLDFMEKKPAGLEMILTGRNATPMMIEHADYVSSITSVKHPFEQNIHAREGIEY
jgi:cob(I)alamin adenosyltransferase